MEKATKTKKRFRISEKMFVNIFANVIIVLIVAVILAASFGSEFLIMITGNPAQAIYRGNSNKKNVSVMINVYWGTEYIDDMLLILKEHDAKATFFLGGTWVNKNTETVKKIAAEGHEIGNHGFFHLDHKKISYEKNREEIIVTEKLIEGITGIKTTLFAPPSGSYNAGTLKVAQELGYKTIMWSKDTIDWRDKDTQLIYTRATKDVKNGDLLLTHPTKNTVDALPDILRYYIAQGFNIVTVSENIA